MQGVITKPDAKSLALITQIDGVMGSVQSELDTLYSELVAAEKVVDAVRAKIAKIKPELVPFAEMKSALANSRSKDKYFPQVDDITSYVDSIING